MPTKEEEFKYRFIDLVADLHANGRNDAQAMALVGSLAANVLDQANADNWVDFKRSLAPQSYDQLLDTLQTEGNAVAAQGREKAVYALQVLSVSLIAGTQETPEVKSGEHLLDDLIDAAVTNFRQHHPATP